MTVKEIDELRRRGEIVGRQADEAAKNLHRNSKKIWKNGSTNQRLV